MVLDATTKPDNLPTKKESSIWAKAQADEAAAEKQREHDNRVDLLITPKGHQRLRAFGFEVVKVAESLKPSTTDKRSL